MDFSDEVLTRGKSGKLELRTLHSRGSFVICKYLDPETLKVADKKTKLTLKDENGTVEEYFVIPLKDPRRSLLVKAGSEEKSRGIWNEQTQREEEL